MIVATCDTISARARPCPPELVRTLIKPTHWQTTKTAPDGIWERYSTVSSGTGQQTCSSCADTSADGSLRRPAGSSGVYPLSDFHSWSTSGPA